MAQGKPGDYGQNVFDIRNALSAAGYATQLAGADLADPFSYDDELAGAVRSFQQSNGLSVDGIVGKNTEAKLFGFATPTAAPAPAPAPYVSPAASLPAPTPGGFGGLSPVLLLGGAAALFAWAYFANAKRNTRKAFVHQTAGYSKPLKMKKGKKSRRVRRRLRRRHYE